MSVLLVKIRMLFGYIYHLPGRVRRAMQWRKVMKAAEADYRKPKNPVRVEAGKKSWETRRKNQNLLHVQSLAEFKAVKGNYEYPAQDEGADIVDVA